MALDPPTPPANAPRIPGRPLAGWRWSLETPEDHWARHDREQVRYWASLPFAERLAQAERYRVRVSGVGPFAFPRTFKLLPSVVAPDET